MTKFKALTAAGLIVAVAGMAFADPSLTLKPAGAKATKTAGAVVWLTVANADGGVSGAEIHVKFDAAKVSIDATQGVSFTPAAGWSQNAANVINGNEVIWVGSNNNGQKTDGPLVTINFVQGTGSSKITLTTDTNIADNSSAYYPIANQDAAVINGAVRQVGPIAGAPSTGPGKVVAVAAGGSLMLLDADTLADKSGFIAPAVGTVSGRPAFGFFANPVIAVGNDAGHLIVVDAATGGGIADLALGTKVSTPAVAADGIYAAVTNASGPATIVKVVGGTAAPFTTCTGTTVTGAPAVFLGGVAIGSEVGVESFRADGTHQAGVASTGPTTAPIVGAGGAAMAGNATSLLRFNIVTGNGAAVAQPGGALSEAWLEGSTVTFGTASGSLLTADLLAGAPTLVTPALSTLSLAGTEPIVIGGVTWAMDSSGAVLSTAGASFPLAGAPSKALAATGRTSGTDAIIAATADGTVASIAF